uniref:non-specific serine/threonine protein kinase n=1 Tax=Jaculus jaculus TaxID=51337 RepID=A0A8C5KL85_JACJA
QSAEGEAKPWSAGLDKPEVKRAPESLAGERSEEKHPGSRRGAPRPGRMRRPGVRGNAKRLLRRDSAPEGIPRPPPQDPPEQPLTQSNQRETPHAKARAPGWRSPLHAEQCAFPTPAEQDPKTPGPPADSLSKEGATSFEGGRMLPSNLFEMSQAPEQSDDRQMHIWETSGECCSPSQKSPFSMPAGKTSSSAGTTTDFFSNLKETHKESASSAHLGLESCAQGPQREDRQGREGRMPGGPWAEAVDEQRAPESSDEKAFPALPLACLPRDISAQCMEPAEPSPALENVHSGSRDREAACVVECFEASDQGTCYDTMEPPVGTPVDKYLLQEICPMDFELTEGHRKVPDLCSSDKTLAVLPHTRGPEAPPSTGEGSKHRNSAESSFLTRTFTQAVSLEASEGAVGGRLAEGEKSWPSPFNSGGLLETQPLSFEDSSLGPLSEGDDERPISSAPDAPDSPASHSQFPQELSTALTADSEYLPVTRDVEDTSLSVTSNVAPSKYHAVSISESDFVHSAGERPHEAPSELHFQFPHNVLIGSTNESSRKLRRLVPRVAGGPGPILRRLRGEEGVYSNSLLQTGNDSRGKNRAEHQADSGSLQGDFREKGSETERRLPPQSQHFCQASLSAKDFQESWSPATDMPGEIRLSSGAPVEEEAAESLRGQEAHAGLGAWEVGHKVKVIILEASDCEIWPPRQMTESEGKEGPEASAMSPGRDWALSDTPKADATVPSGVASWAHGPPADTATATAFDSARGSWAGDAPGTDAHWDNLPSQCSDLPTLLGSSVDPVEDVLDPRPGASATGGKAGMSTASHVREEHQDKVDHPAFLKQLLHFPGVLESSVDPVNDKDGRTRPRGESPLPGLGEASLGPTEAGPAILQAPHRQDSAGASPDETSTGQGQGDREQGETRQGQHGGAKAEVQPDVWQVPYPAEGGQGIPGAFGMSQMQGGSDRSPGEAERPFATSALPGPHAVMTHPLAKAATHTCTGEPEPGSPQSVLSPLKQRGAIENTCGDCVPTSSDQTHWPWLSSPEGNITHCLRSHSIEEPKMVLTGETEALSSSSSPTLAPVFISRERESETAPKLHQDLCQKGSILGNPKRTREKPSHVPTQTGKLLGAPWAGNGAEVVRRKQESSGSGHLAEGIKKKVLSKVAALRLRLEEKENVQKNSGLLTKIPKLEKSLSCTEERREPKKAPCMREGKAPVLLKKIQAEMSPDHSGNVKLSCQFAEIHEDSTIWWTKDSKSIAQVQRSAGDNSSVSLAIMQAGQKDQGLYYCDIANSYGKVTAEFNLTAEVLKGLSRHMDSKGCEEIEFSQLILREDFLNDSYFGGRLRGQIATEELHFGEGVHRRAFRSTVMRGLLPVFQPGHACVLKVHNAIAHGTRDNDELVQKNYKLAAQECYVQNTARHYAKIYAAEAQPLEGFGEVPEIIPIFLIHRPENNIPYATVEEELIGEFVKYSIRDGKEINFLRRDSEAGQKCCTFQHWVYQKTGGCLLVTDMQGVGMKLTDVGIATLAK